MIKRKKIFAPWGDRTLDHQLKRLALYRWANEAPCFSFDNLNLNVAINDIYFKPWDKSIIEGLKILKNFVAKLYIDRPDPA